MRKTGQDLWAPRPYETLQYVAPSMYRLSPENYASYWNLLLGHPQYARIHYVVYRRCKIVRCATFIAAKLSKGEKQVCCLPHNYCIYNCHPELNQVWNWSSPFPCVTQQRVSCFEQSVSRALRHPVVYKRRSDGPISLNSFQVGNINKPPVWL